jgi:hypothetical protein
LYAVDETTAVAFVLIVNPVVVILTQTAWLAARLAVAALAGVITTTGADEKAVLYVIVAKTAFIEGLVPVVSATTPLMSVPVTVIPEGEVPAPVEAAILNAPEFPFMCFALMSLVVTIVPDVLTFVTDPFPSTILFDVEFVAPLPSDVALVTPSPISA